MSLMLGIKNRCIIPTWLQMVDSLEGLLNINLLLLLEN